MEEPRPQLVYEFGEFQLDARRRVLRSRQERRPVELTPKALEALIYLVERAGQVVEKQALFEAVWPNVVVEEGNLTQTIHVLRRALGEHPDDHRFIVTVPGRGYRFVADVTRPSQPDENRGDTALAKIDSGTGRTVRPRALIRAAALVGVLSVGLLAFAWYAGWFAREATPVNPGSNPHPYAAFGTDAYLAFLKGNSLLATRKVPDAESAIERFSYAIEVAPTFAAAFAALAEAHRHLAYLVDDSCSSPGMQAVPAKALPLLERALALDASLGRAYVVRADLEFCAGDVAAAEADFRKGLELSPEYAAGHERFAEFLFDQQQIDEALVEIDRARELDPHTPRYPYLRGLFLEGRGKAGEAEEWYLQALQIAPDFVPARSRLAALRAYDQGLFAEGVKLAEQAVAIDPRTPWTLTRPVHFYLEMQDVDAARAFVSEQAESERPALWLPICLYENRLQRAAEIVRANPNRWSDFMGQDVELYLLRDTALAGGEFTNVRADLPELLKRSHESYLKLGLAQLSLALGDRREGERLLHEILDDKSPRAQHPQAIALALLGKPQAALDVLEEEFESGWRKRWWYVFEREAAFAELRRDPRFQRLAQRARDHAAVQRTLLDQMRARGEVPTRNPKPDSVVGGC